MRGYLAKTAALCDEMRLAPECGTRDRLAGNQSGPSATGSGFPLVICKRIRAQNSGQGPFILSAEFSLAYKDPETGTKGESSACDGWGPLPPPQLPVAVFQGSRGHSHPALET